MIPRYKTDEVTIGQDGKFREIEGVGTLGKYLQSLTVSYVPLSCKICKSNKWRLTKIGHVIKRKCDECGAVMTIRPGDVKRTFYKKIV